MSSYRGESGAWDGGPPGAEADYAPQRAPPHAAPLPTTDPWTGVSYSQYGPPQYDYQGFGAPGYGYNYDSTYYQRADGGYYDSSRNVYPSQQLENYEYARDRSRPAHGSREYDRSRQSYRSNSRSASPYERKDREYSKKRESSYDGSRGRKSRSASKQKHSKYSSSDRSSYRSRSYSRSPKKTKKRRQSDSSQSSRSDRSFKTSSKTREDCSMTPPLKGRSNSRNRSYDNEERLKSRSSSSDKESISNKRHGYKKSSKSKDRRQRDVYTPPRKDSDSPKSQKKSSKSSITQPNKKSERSPQRKTKYRKSLTPPRKPKDSSVTPPRCYARTRSSSSSSSRSRSLTPKSKRKRSCTPKSRRSRSSSSSRSSTRSDDKRRIRRKPKHGSRSKSRSRDRSVAKGRSTSRHHSSSRFRNRRSRTPKGSKSRSKSRSSRSHSRSRSVSPSDDECRGQFTVADRKRFWKMHRSRQEKAERSRTPPKEVKPPPGAIESTRVDDVHYGDPPELEGPNFAELLPTPDQFMHAPSTSKSKPIPIPIKNDGSFLEMFKKMQEETKKAEPAEAKPIIKKPVLPFIGKRRGGRVLKTGLVKKAKAIDEQTVDNTPKDAWSLYMQEVKKYRETSCEEERKTRPLVK
ncbi:serine/arginine repetitive matrix protein 5 [Melitaea cinxia]|uniref:serine/arginine repetitive matrix protein 5 n=1 Tax=Melitaea cinxia TaxID=113334 RepID=UPI001E26FB8B|nr:serine/arginine repetitive matrix protein 5 [Melitaea cinxia]